ncbi:hypothetical protein ACTFIV_010736 [Dictyostelium citrinum]
MNNIKEQYVLVGSKRNCKPFKMSYKTFGNGPNKVLFVMGFQLEGKFWSNIVGKYMNEPEEYTICTFDICGTGSSGYSFFSSFKDLAMDMIELLYYLKWDKSHIVALSAGTAISWEMVRMEPDLIKSLNILSIPSFYLGQSTMRQFLMLPIYSRLHNIEKDEMYSRLIVSDSFFNSPSKYKPGLNKEFVMPLTKNMYNSRFNLKYKARFSHWISLAFHKVKQFHEEPYERKFPIVMFVGTDDPFVNESINHRYLYEIFKPNLIYICKSAGHCLQTEDHERYNQLSMEFIDFANNYKPDTIDSTEKNQFLVTKFLDYNIGYRIPSSKNPFPLKNSILINKIKL